MSWLVDNWYLLVAAIAVIVASVMSIIYFVKQPTAVQIQNLKEWLKYAVSEAEAALGSGTGQLKLRKVYDMAIKVYPWITKFVKFESFSKWVDDALEWMKDQLENNKKISEYVKGNENE